MRTAANDGIVVRLAIHAADVTNCVCAINVAVLLSVVVALAAVVGGGQARAAQIAKDVGASFERVRVTELRGIHSVKSSHGP